MIGQPLCAAPIAAHISPAALVSTDNFRLVDILCRFAAEALQSARFAPIRQIYVHRNLVFVNPCRFTPLLAQRGLYRLAVDLFAIFQPEET